MALTETSVRKVIPIAATPGPVEAPAGAEPEMVALYEAHKKIYPRSVSGRFSRWRWALVFLTQLVFYGMPWLEWGQRQAVLFDLGAGAFTSSTWCSTRRTSSTSPVCW